MDQHNTKCCDGLCRYIIEHRAELVEQGYVVKETKVGCSVGKVGLVYAYIYAYMEGCKLRERSEAGGWYEGVFYRSNVGTCSKMAKPELLREELTAILKRVDCIVRANHNLVIARGPKTKSDLKPSGFEPGYHAMHRGTVYSRQCLQRCSVVSLVSIANNRRVVPHIDRPGQDPWFLVDGRGPDGTIFEFITDGEKYLPINRRTRKAVNKRPDGMELSVGDQDMVKKAIEYFVGVAV